MKVPDDITGYPMFPRGTGSLLAKYLSPEIYAKFEHDSDAHGVPFKQMILSGCQNLDSGIGIYAGSHDSYSKFAEIFDQVILDYHKHDKNASHVSNMNH